MRQSRDYEKVGTKTNARAWKQLAKYKDELREARERNPLLAEQYDALNDEILHHRQLAVDAWGHHYPVDERAPQDMRDYYRQHVDPLQAQQNVIRDMLYCKHARVDDQGEFLSCRKCGAVDFGRGFLFHDPIIASKSNLG